MSLEKMPVHRYRLWDSNYELIGEWDGPPPTEALIDGRNMTIDYSSGQRWSGRIVDGEPVDDFEFLSKILTWPNPYFPELPEQPA
jgi:hypothetical protein